MFLKGKKLLLIICSSILALSMLFFVACKKDSTPTEKTEETKKLAVTSHQKITNGDFEYGINDSNILEIDADDFPYTSPNGWSKSYDKSSKDITSAQSVSSSTSSGIFDTALYDSMSDSKKIVDKDDSSKYYNPKTPYAYGLITRNEEDYSLVVDEEDNKTYNYNATEEYTGPTIEGDRILAISNITTNKLGTAQYFSSSSSLTIPKGQKAKLSVWVQTYNIKPYNNDIETGAYIKLKTTINGLDCREIIVDNINTKDIWANIEIYIDGSDFADVIISSVTLGLGHGNSSQYARYVEGYAFFDNISFEILDSKEDIVSPSEPYFVKPNILNKKESQLFVELDGEYYQYATTIEGSETFAEKNKNFTPENLFLDFIKESSVLEYVDLAGFTPTWNSVALGNDKTNEDFRDNDSKIGQIEIDELPEELKGEFITSVNGFNFITSDSAKIITDSITISPKGYQIITFYSTADIKNFADNGAKIAIIEEQNFETEKLTSVFDKVTVQKSEELGNWNKYTIIAKNNSDTDVAIKLAFQFGKDHESYSSITTRDIDLPIGYFYIANLENCALEDSEKTKNIVSLFATGDYVKNFTTVGNNLNYKEEETETSQVDSYSITTSDSMKINLEKGYVENNNNYTFSGDETKTSHGIINTEYDIESIYGISYTIDDINPVNENKFIQALTILNKENTTAKYIGQNNSFAANTYNKVKVVLKVYGEGKAVVSLKSKELDDGKFKDLLLNENNPFTKEFTESTVSNEGNNWIELYLYVLTGKNAKDYKIEIELQGKGLLLINEISTSTIEEAAFQSEKDKVVSSYERWNEGANKLITSEDKYVDSNQYVVFGSYKDLEPNDEEPETEEEETEEEESTNPADDVYNVSTSALLQVSTTIIAAALIIAIVGVIIRQMVTKNRKKKKKVKEYYNKSTRDIANENISKKKAKLSEEKAKLEVKEVEESTEEYNYDEAENIEEKTEEQIVEEVVEEIQNTNENQEQSLDENIETTNEEVVDNNQPEEPKAEEIDNTSEEKKD